VSDPNNIRAKAHNLAEAITVHLMIEVSKDARVQKDPTQFQKVMTEYDRYMSEWQRDLQKTPQSMVELFAKAGVIADWAEDEE
jgi:hypothetical protein